jgi:hypothetical protein
MGEVASSTFPFSYKGVDMSALEDLVEILMTLETYAALGAGL